MTELTTQRRLFAVLAISSVMVGIIEFRDIGRDHWVEAAIRGIIAAALGFIAMVVRERYLQKTGKRPLDKPRDILTFVIVMSGVSGLLFQLLGPTGRVFLFGLGAGVCVGLYRFIDRDLRRLGRLEPDPRQREAPNG